MEEVRELTKVDRIGNVYSMLKKSVLLNLVLCSVALVSMGTMRTSEV